MRKRNPGSTSKDAQALAQAKKDRRIRRLAKRKELVANRVKALAIHIEQLNNQIRAKDGEIMALKRESNKE